MSNFNTKLVEYLDHFNHGLAFIFVILGIFRFIELAGDNILTALFELLTMLGVGVLTCGYIALMININNLLTQIRDGGKK